jgi:hypothetical protein
MPAEESLSIELALMPALKEPEHIILAEGLTILQQQSGLSTEEANPHTRRAYGRAIAEVLAWMRAARPCLDHQRGTGAWRFERLSDEKYLPPHESLSKCCSGPEHRAH